MNIVSKFTVENNNKYQSDKGFRDNVNFVLTFISVLIFGVFAIRPSISAITGLLRDIEEYKKVNSVLVEKISILNEVNSHPDELDREKQLISRALPTTPDEGNYIRNVNFIAGKNNIQTQSMTFGVTKEDGLGALTFNMEIAGEYPNVVNFLTDFNKLLRITTIDSIAIQPESAVTQAVTARISGKAYFIDELNEIPEPSTQKPAQSELDEEGQ